MNIFALSECPEQSALWLDDIRKNKMILESAQMLSTAIRSGGLTLTQPCLFTNLHISIIHAVNGQGNLAVISSGY
jgi:hypothetical protein